MGLAKDGKSKLLLFTITLGFQVPQLGYCDQDLNSLEFKTFQTHSHLRIPVDLDIQYKIEKIEKNNALAGLRIVFFNAAHTRIGKVGDTEVALTDARTASIKKSIANNDVSYVVMFTDKAVKSGLDYFDYRDRNKSEIYLDYWFVSNPEKVTKNSEERRVAQVRENENKVEVTTKKSRDINLLDIKVNDRCLGHIDPADEQTVNYNVYHRDYDFIPLVQPLSGDTSYEFRTVKGGALADGRPDGASHYNLALKLYKQKKFGLALRTIELYYKEFKDPELDAEVNFLKAAALSGLGKELKSDRINAESLGIYQAIAKQDNNLDRSRRARLYILNQAIESKDNARIYSLALEYSSVLKEDKPMLLFMAAEYAYLLGDDEKALAHYNELISLNVEPYSVEAQYRIGETKMRLGDYEKALVDYKNALKKYPKSVENLSYSVFNMAECLYRLGKLSESMEMFKEFRVRFPQDKVLWAADLKIPEIERMITKDTRSIKEAIRKRYVHVINRHPYSIGAFIARNRLSACVSKEKNSEVNYYRAFYSKKNYDYIGSLMLNPIELKLMTELSEVRFYNKVEESSNVLPFIIDYRDRIETMKLGASFKKEFIIAVNQVVTDLNQRKKWSDIREIHEKFEDFAGVPMSNDYLLAVAKAYAANKQLKTVKGILDDLSKNYNTMTSVQKDQYNKLAFLNKRLLGAPDTELENHLLAINDDGDSNDFKYAALSKQYISQNNYESALNMDLKLLQLESKHIKVPVKLESTVRAIQSYAKLGRYNDAAQLADRMLVAYGTHTKYHVLLNEIRKLRVENLFQSHDYGKTIQAIDELYEISSKDFENQDFKAKYEFMKAKSLFSINRKQEAQEAYRRIANMGKSIWAKSAKAELELAELNKDQDDLSKTRKQ
jgi:tetratricopeptide (TPR) repeat protein